MCCPEWCPFHAAILVAIIKCPLRLPRAAKAHTGGRKVLPRRSPPLITARQKGHMTCTSRLPAAP
eukprot:803405-Pyramimonas_sp.AAC.1